MRCHSLMDASAAQRGRIVLEPAPPGARERLASLGVELVAEQDATVLGARVR
jgi:hypothetical protein